MLSFIWLCQVLNEFSHCSSWLFTLSYRCFCNIMHNSSWKFSWLAVDFIVFVSLISTFSSWSIFLNQTQLTPKILQLLHVWLHYGFGNSRTNLWRLISIPLSSKVFSSSYLLVHFVLSFIEFCQTHSRQMRNSLSWNEWFLSFLSRSSLRFLWHSPLFFIQYGWI